MHADIGREGKRMPSNLAHHYKVMAVDARTLGGMLGLSLRTIRTMDAAGKLPRPVQLNGRAVRWVLDGPKGIRAWLTAGAPDRSTFEARMNNQPTGKRQ